MILEPRKTAEEIDRRLSTLNDPQLTALLEDLNRSFSSDDIESYTSPEAPYWKRRIALVALAGLFATSAGYGFVAFQPSSHQHPSTKPHVAIPAPPPVHRQRKVAVHHTILKPQHTLAVTPHRVVPAAAAPNEALIREARAQLLHERAIAAQAQAQAAYAAAQVRAQAAALANARAQARAEALAQARAEAQAQARAEALAREQAENAAAQARQDWVVQNASGPGTKSVDVPPTDNGHISTYPRPGIPAPMPGPIDPNCTPHRGSLFTTAVNAGLLDHVRVGGTSVGGFLRMIH